jgi:hypothetical protein
MVKNLSNEFMNETQETNDQQTDGMVDKEDDQKQGNRAHRRAWERAQKELLEDAERRKASAQHRASRPSILMERCMHNNNVVILALPLSRIPHTLKPSQCHTPMHPPHPRPTLH